MNQQSFKLLPMAVVCLALCACAPVPRLRANWYAVLDTEAAAAPSVDPKADQPTEDVYRKLLAILNEDTTPLTISKVSLNPWWTRSSNEPGRKLNLDASAKQLLPGEMLLIELEIERIPSGQKVRPRTGTPTPWTCDIPTRVKLDVQMERRLWGQQGYKLDVKDVLVDIAQPFPTSLPLGWAHKCKMAPGIPVLEQPTPPASGPGS